MPVTTSATANEIITRAAVEVGLDPIVDAFSSKDQAYVQLRYLINSVGEDLSLAHEWEFLSRTQSILTQDDNSGEYSLPEDFLYIINQTAWERNNRVPVQLLSPQDWAYLEGRQFAKDTIYVRFRLQQGKFTLYPQPTPLGLDINYEYFSKNWVLDSTVEDGVKSQVTTGNDKPLFDRTLMIKALKVKFLEAKGFDTSKAQDDLNFVFNSLTGHDKGAPLLSAGRGVRGFPYLDGYRNVSDTNYGNP